MRPVISKIALSAIIALSAAYIANAQGSWHGDFNVDFGSNFHTTLLGKNSQHNADLSGSAGYESNRFKIDMSASGTYEYLFTGMLGLTLKDNGQDTTGTVDASANEIESRSANTGISMVWKPSKTNIFKFDYGFSHNKRVPVNYTLSTDRIPDGSGKAHVEFARENADKSTIKHDATLSFIHNFRQSGKYFQADARARYTANEECSIWHTGEGTGEEITGHQIGVDTYRTTPEQKDRDLLLALLYSSKQFAGAKGLDIDFSAKFDFHGLEEHQSQANYIGGQWVDSASVRENFLYRTSVLTPAVKLKYRVGIYKLDVTFSPELYLRKLDSDEHIGEIDKGAVAFPFKIVNTLEPWKGHTFTLSGERSESRPSYLQICWFPRLKSVYANEYYMGNPDLENAITGKANFSYKFSPGRFSTVITYGHIYKRGKIEQIYNTQDIEGKSCRVYTWINGGYSHENNVKLRLAWQDKRFSASAEGKYNYYVGVKNNGKETRSSDYSLNADISYSLEKWKFSASADYQSDIIRSYQSITSIIGVNARIERKFERSTLFLQGSNLADRPVRMTTYSSDGKECRIEETRNNLRLFIVGAHFDF